MFDEMEEIDRSDDGKIRLFGIGPPTNNETPDAPEVKVWRRLYGYFVKSERCCNCNYWEYGVDSCGHTRNTWCNLIAKECNIEKPYAPRDGWCERWAKNCTAEDWKGKNNYDGHLTSYIMVAKVNPHPRPTEDYNCTTCPACEEKYDLVEYPSLAEMFKKCRVAEEDTAREFLTSAEHVCELHPETARAKAIRETELKQKAP